MFIDMITVTVVQSSGDKGVLFSQTQKIRLFVNSDKKIFTKLYR
jgi:hypothetical protein